MEAYNTFSDKKTLLMYSQKLVLYVNFGGECARYTHNLTLQIDFEG